jgi:hypothetical protein
MKILPLATFVLGALLSAPVAAQSCADLTVTGSGRSGTQLTFAVTGAGTNSPAYLVIGQTAGSFSISLGPIGTLTLGIVPPFTFVPLGSTDGSGAVSRSVTVPPIPDAVSVLGQAFSAKVVIDRGVRVDFCTSDVESFSIGGS